jgi:hypothetical protein
VIRLIAALCGTNALYGNSQEITMSTRSLLFVTAFAFASLGAAHAGGMRPIEAKSIDLGEVSGVAYYTVERDGLHVVTTLAQGETGIPIRVVSVLAPGQSVVLSTPHASGAIEISRKGDGLLVRKATAVAEAMPPTSNPTGHDRVSTH